MCALTYTMWGSACALIQVDIWGWVGGFKIIFAPDNSIL